MDSNTVTVAISVVGAISTLVASGLGLYFTARARSAPLRELLYSKQLELITKIIYKQARFQVYAILLSSSNSEFKKRAREDSGSCVKEYSELTEKASAILPTDLWVEVKKLSDYMAGLLIGFDKRGSLDEQSISRLEGMGAKVVLVSRAILGVDQLTEESLKLFSAFKDLKQAVAIEPEYLEQLK